jgi:two-component system chemotaxis response regulator CheY
MKILLIDDSADSLLLLRRFFRDKETVCAENGRVALEITHHHDFDLIITDWDMPEMNGGDFINATPHLNHKTIIFSASEVTHPKVRFFKKPDDLKKLLTEF